MDDITETFPGSPMLRTTMAAAPFLFRKLLISLLILSDDCDKQQQKILSDDCDKQQKYIYVIVKKLPYVHKQLIKTSLSSLYDSVDKIYHVAQQPNCSLTRHCQINFDKSKSFSTN